MNIGSVQGQDATQQDWEPRCWRCNKKLAELVTRPWTIVCWRCKARNQGLLTPGDRHREPLMR